MAELPRLILAVTPDQAKSVHTKDFTPAHVAYRLESGPTLNRLRHAQPGPGGLLYLGEDRLSGNNYSFLLQQILRECAARHFQGVIADLPEDAQSLVAILDEALPKNALTLYVPERFQPQVKKARLMVSTSLSGGSLRRHLQEKTERFGANRLVAVLERRAVTLTPDGNGHTTPLTREALEGLKQQRKPQIHFSPELCMRYFTYSDQGQLRFVLYDDRETLSGKRRLCGELGIRVCLTGWGDMQP